MISCFFFSRNNLFVLESLDRPKELVVQSEKLHFLIGPLIVHMICAYDLLEFQTESLPWTIFLPSDSPNHMLPLVPLVNYCTFIRSIRLI